MSGLTELLQRAYTWGYWDADSGLDPDLADWLQLPKDPPLTPNEAAALGTHDMDPDRRHSLCGFDLAGERKMPPPPPDFERRPIECPLCRAVLAAVG